MRAKDAPRLAAISSLPPATTLVEPSSTYWKPLPVGAATLITLAPYTGLLAPGGTTMFPPVVMEMPIISRRAALRA